MPVALECLLLFTEHLIYAPMYLTFSPRHLVPQTESILLRALRSSHAVTRCFASARVEPSRLHPGHMFRVNLTTNTPSQIQLDTSRYFYVLTFNMLCPHE
jgi:hypothetical protein